MPALDSLTILDFAVLGVLVLSAFLSFIRGGVREVLGLACWIGAAVVAVFFFAQVQPIVREQLGNDLIANIGTAVGLFLIPLIIFKIIAGMIANEVADGFLGGVDRIVGLVFGLLRGALIVLAGWLMAGQIVPADKLPDWVSGAWSKPYLNEGAELLRGYLPEGFLEDAGDTTGAVIDGAETLERLQSTEPDASEGTAAQ